MTRMSPDYLSSLLARLRPLERAQLTWGLPGVEPPHSHHFPGELRLVRLAPMLFHEVTACSLYRFMNCLARPTRSARRRWTEPRLELCLRRPKRSFYAFALRQG